MRAQEFLVEKRTGKIGNRRQAGTRGLTKFRDIGGYDRTYELNRVMMAAASTDGTFVPDIDGESWAGRYDIAAPYTPEEHDMLKMAYKAIGSEFQDLNKGDLRSQEIPSTSTVSPIKAFKGYAR